MFKQCLENDIPLFMVTEFTRNQYIDCLKMFHIGKTVNHLENFAREQQEKFMESYKEFLIVTIDKHKSKELER
jgi:hypothetical protein